jgi:hypothetical protein
MSNSKNVAVSGFKKTQCSLPENVLLSKNYPSSTPDNLCSPTVTKTVPETKIVLKEIDFSVPAEEYDDEEDNIPETINITYKNHVDIILIHNTIRKKFAFERGKVEDYYKEITDIDNAFRYSMSINDLRKLKCDRLKLMEKIEEITSLVRWNYYAERAKPLLEHYQILTSAKSKSVVFIGKRILKEEDKANIEARISLIQEYINLASEVININATRIEKLVATCPICETKFEDFEVDEDVGICECTKCGWYRENIAKFSCNKDSGRTSSNNKNDYEDRENFQRAAIRFACKQNKSFHPNLELDLDVYFVKLGVGTGAEIKAKPSIKGRKKGVNFQMMITALSYLSKATNGEYKYREVYSDYYEDAWLIMVNYWGFAPNDIMKYIPELLEKYDKTQEEYINMTPAERGGRNASLNTQYRLLVLLLAVGYPCSKADFKIQKESLDNHQRLWKKMCFRSGVKFCEII